MGNLVFWVCFVLLIATLIISTALRSKRAKEHKLRILTEGFGSSEKTVSDPQRFDEVPALLGYMKKEYPDDFCIDDITLKDLSIRDVFARINRCVTSAGEDYIICRLRMLHDDHLCALSFYDEITGYINDPDRAKDHIRILSSFSKREHDVFKSIDAVNEADASGILYDVMPLSCLVASFVLSCFYPKAGMLLAVAAIIICVATYFAGKRVMDFGLAGLSASQALLRCARSLLRSGRDDLNEYESLWQLTRGDRLISYKDQTTSNPFDILLDYIRMITHIDLIAYKIKISGIKGHVDELRSLYERIGRIDASISLASVLLSKDHCKAESCDEYRISTKGIYHPLVRRVPVKNDLEANRGILLTGSNASGKSTFLKAVGLNLIFAASFGFALADSFETGIRCIYTSMATTDDIIGSKSYYVVEAESIKRICDVAGKRPSLVIIDEVLRGTNTVERIAASTGILKHLSQEGILCFAATHDLELATLLDGYMDLYYFTEEIKEDDVVFPFVIKKGMTDRTNAIRMLKMLGFDDSIVSSARELVGHYRNTGSWT